VNGSTVLAAVTARGHRMMPRLAGSVHTALFINTRGLGRVPADVCPLGARRIELTGVPRVAAAYVWGGGDPTVLALHGWATDSTTMSTVVAAAVANGESAICFDAPGHGVSPGSQATITEYSNAVGAVLQRFPTIQTVVAHSLSSIAGVAAIARSDSGAVHNMLLLAPACSLSGVLDRWALQRRLPAGVVTLIADELHRRDGVPVSHWDIRTLGIRDAVRVNILHDPADRSVPVSDSYQIAGGIGAELGETPGTGHHGILGSESMRAALAACLRNLDEPNSLHRRAIRSP
jgi:Alpha/beta hydrolase family